MTLEELRDYCLALPHVSEHFPFDNETLVFKVYDKMFALTNVCAYESINLKCEPEKALRLREKYDSIQGGYHMNKKHWNTIRFDPAITDALLKEWIVDSYSLVLQNIPQKTKQ